MTKFFESGRRSGKRAEIARRAAKNALKGNTTAIITPDDVVVVSPNAKAIPETKKLGGTKKPTPR